MTFVFWISSALIVYVLIGYPVILYLLSFVGREKEGIASDDSLPTVSLIIPAHNEIKVIQDKLENATQLDYPKDKLEIVVGSDGSQDGTNEVVKTFAEHGVKLLDFNPRRGKASVLNDSVSEVSGELLCMCDANVMFAKNAIRVLVDRMSDPRIGAATGTVLLQSDDSNFGSGESAYYSVERRIQLAESKTGALMGVDGGMYMIRRDLFSKLPADTILDDFIVSMRVIKQGFRVVFVPEAQATENGTPLASQEWRRRVRVAAGATQSIVRGEFPAPWRPIVFWQYVSHKLLRWMVPFFLLAALISNIFLISQHWFYIATFVVQCLVYGCAIISTGSVAFRQTKFGAVPFYFVMSNAAVFVGLFKGLLNLQPVTWTQADRA